jgi:hypothetical protein
MTNIVLLTVYITYNSGIATVIQLKEMLCQDMLEFVHHYNAHYNAMRLYYYKCRCGDKLTTWISVTQKFQLSMHTGYSKKKMPFLTKNESPC